MGKGLMSSMNDLLKDRSKVPRANGVRCANPIFDRRRSTLLYSTRIRCISRLYGIDDIDQCD